MTYLQDGDEHLDAQELRIYGIIRRLNDAHRSANSSQVAAAAQLGRTTVTGVCQHLAARGFLTDTGTGAYHWRVTAQPVPYTATDRAAADRQRQLNEQIRNSK